MQTNPEYSDLDDLNKQFQGLTIKMVGQENEEEDPVPDDQSEDDLEDILQKTAEDFKPSKKHINYTSIEERAREDMDFRDEVDTPLDVPARERFSKYRGLRNLRTSDWDPYENLPAHYAKIFTFQDLFFTRKQSLLASAAEGLPINGAFVELVLKPLDE